MDYAGKLKVIMLNEEDLLTRKERMRQHVLRMKGITQSYNIFDAPQYKALKPLMSELRGGAHNDCDYDTRRVVPVADGSFGNPNG